MAEINTSYAEVTTTGRGADLLAQHHGFNSARALAAWLPTEARAIDVGAGVSPLGKEIALLRPDVDWTNFDYSYYDPAILARVTHDTPENVTHIAGDATQLEAHVEPGSYDVVLSYWMVQHLALDGTAPAVDAVRGMFSLAKANGYISIGPERTGKVVQDLLGGRAIHVTKQTQNPGDFAQEIVERTRPVGLTRTGALIGNRILSPYFGTSNYQLSPPGSRIVHVPHPETGEAISLASIRVLPVLAGALRASGKFAVTELRNRK